MHFQWRETQMVYGFNRKFNSLFRRARVIFLAFCWMIGIGSGILFAANFGHLFTSLMYCALNSTGSIVGFVSVLLFPFLVSAFAVFISRPWLLFGICFLKGFSFSAASFGMLLAFPSGGWLLRQLLMFSSLASLPLLFWYWLRHISSEAEYSSCRSMFVFSLLILIGSVDVCCVSPFLAMLIKS